MSIAHKSIPLLFLTLLGCSSSDEAPSEREAEAFAAIPAALDVELRLLFFLFDASAPTEGITRTLRADQRATNLSSSLPSQLGGCVDVVSDSIVSLEATFSGCVGPYDESELNGTVSIAFEDGEQDRMNVSSTDLRWGRWRMRLRSIAETAGGPQEIAYTTDSVFEVDGRTLDFGAGTTTIDTPCQDPSSCLFRRTGEGCFIIAFTDGGLVDGEPASATGAYERCARACPGGCDGSPECRYSVFTAGNSSIVTLDGSDRARVFDGDEDRSVPVSCGPM